MATDNVKKSGPADGYKTDRGGATLVTEPVIGIVKNNVDATHSGRIEVYIATFGGQDPDNRDNWTPVDYLSPYIGVSSPGNNPTDGPDKTGNGKFLGNPQSYGWWASSPDIGTKVLCIFVNGRIDQGYYIGCIPTVGLLQMTPAVGSSNKVVPNDVEATTYGGVDRLPTSEVNYSNPTIRKSAEIYNEAKPVHSYQASILAQQGLIRDKVRGTVSSSAQRESPSRVFGISTPGGPIFEGGYTAATIAAAVKKPNIDKLKMIGRTGGHSFVMDDGTLTGQDQLIRLRSSAGHQITMSDSGQTLFIIHSNGQSWIEMGKEGTIDIFSTNSFNVRTQGDINFHADRDINLNAKRNLNMYGESINIESATDFSVRAGGAFKGYAVESYTFKTDGSMSMSADGDASLAGGGAAFINGSKVNLNTGSAGLTPMSVPAMTKVNHIDTSYSEKIGWMNPAPNPITSITTRTPAHQPWIGSGKGVDDQTDSPTPVPASQQTTAEVDKANSAAPSSPSTPTSPSSVAAVPSPSSSVGPLTPTAVGALTSQVATNAQSLTVTQQTAAGILNPATGLTTKMAETAGVTAPGSSSLIDGLMAKGMSASKAMVGSITNSSMNLGDPKSFINNIGGQGSVVQTAISTTTKALIKNGTLTGNESPAQAGGMVMAGLSKGADAVGDALKKGGASLSGMYNDIASGKFAGGLADSKSGTGGLSLSLSGLSDSFSGGLDSLKSGLQKAFASVESSYGKLKGGVVNALGPNNKETAPPSATAKAASDYDSAKAAVAAAEDAVLEAKRAYRQSNSSDDMTKLQTAEANLAAANQKVAQASTGYLKAAVGSATSLLPSSIGGVSLASVSSSLKSGLNSLPGGLGSLLSTNNNKTTVSSASPMTSIINTATTAQSTSVFDKASNFTGDIVGKTATAITTSLNSAMASISATTNGAISAAQTGAAGMMGSLQTSMDGIGSMFGGTKSASAGENTFDRTAITAKTGQLLGDPKIPVPTFSDDVASTDADADYLVSAQADAMTAVENEMANVEAAELELSAIYEKIASGSISEADGNSQIDSQQAKVDQARDALLTAQVKYEASIT